VEIWNFIIDYVSQAPDKKSMQVFMRLQIGVLACGRTLNRLKLTANTISI